MYKPGRGGGGGRRPPARQGRGMMAGQGRGRGGVASSCSQQGKEEEFSLESGGAPDFASIIRLVPGLVEEIERLEAQGGTARIKFGSNPLNHTENVIEVGPKQYHFNWSAELGVCDIYEQVQNGESNNGLLLERGSALRKMNVQRILDESAKNQVKMRSVQAELQSKSRKSIILDPANPSVKKQVQSMAAAGVEGSMRRWGGPKDKFKKSNQAPPPKKITIAKAAPAGSPPQHLIETINPKKRLNSENMNYDKRQTPICSNNHYGNNNDNSAEIKTLLIKILSENPKGLSFKALEKSATDSFPDSAKKIESIVKTIANYQAPGRYILKAGFASESSKAQQSDNKSSSDNEEDHDPILQALNEMDYNSTPQNNNNYNSTPQNNNNNNLNLNLEEEPLDIESESPIPNNKLNVNINEEIDIENTSPVLNNNVEIDIENGSPAFNIDIEGGSPVINKLNNVEIDIENGSPVFGKMENSSSDESDSDSDSDSSDNSESSPSRAGSKSQSSSPSESENSSGNEADADLEINIMSDNDEKETLINHNIDINDINVEIIPTDLNLSPQINLNEDLCLTPVENTSTDFDPGFGKKTGRENELGFKRAGTSINMKRASTEKLLEASKRLKNTQESPFSNCNNPLPSKKTVPKLTGKNSNKDDNNNNTRVAINEGFNSDRPLRKHTRENPNLNEINLTPPVKKMRESIESEKLGQKKVLRREKSELELGEFREPISKSPINDDDELKRLFGSSSSSKYDDDSDDININNYNNNYDINVENENENLAVSSLDRLAGTSGTSTSGAQNNNNIKNNINNNNVNNNNIVKNYNGREMRPNNGVGPLKKNRELVKRSSNNNIMQNGNGNNGIEKHYSSSFNDSEEYLIYAKYDKDLADLKGPIHDYAKYKEYVNEYQEKYKVYASLNKNLEQYRDKYLKVGDEMEIAKERNIRDYNKVVERLRDMYQKDKERHEFMKRVFLILHEELANLKQKVSEYYGDCTKDR